MCDFETTVYKGQEYTEVWASACVELYTEDVQLFHSLEELLVYFKSLKCNIVAYFHNLKFDGTFWVSYLIELGYSQAYRQISSNPNDIEFLKNKDMKNNTFKYSISDRGVWYTVTIKLGNHIIEIRDSLKLLPFSVRRIGESFGTKHKKLDMEYEGFRYAGCEITEEEQTYIKNDVLVPKEALEIMFNQGHEKLTIGACCLEEYKKIVNTSTKLTLEYDELFPDMYKFDIDAGTYKYPNAGEWIRKTYRGGWCYLKDDKANIIIYNGLTLDVNSLYPSMMHSMSGNIYPIGFPTFWNGNFIPDKALGNDKYYFIHIRTRFYLKQEHLPTIQIKGNLLYKSTEWLYTSDIKVWNRETQSYEYYTHYPDRYGNMIDSRVDLYLTMTDYQLILEHYELVDFEIINGCYFYAMSGIFDEYIDKYKDIKMHSSGAVRELAKLFLNNLYGKLASSTDSSFKRIYLKDDKSIGYDYVEAHDKKPGYIPCGSAITSYSRNYTIRASQANYGCFLYADTDSMHLCCNIDDVQGVTLHDSEFCNWKLESQWNEGIFVRQKTYIEHVTHEGLKPLDKAYYNIKGAGIAQRSKDVLNASLTGDIEPLKKLTENEMKFLYDNGKLIERKLTDFKSGLRLPSSLKAKRIRGGTVLWDDWYEMR